MLHDWKYASKRSEFLGFYCYLCHVCYGFLCLWIRNTKISENSDMAKSWATFCCPGTYKNNYQSCCGIKEYSDFSEKTPASGGLRFNDILISIRYASLFQDTTSPRCRLSAPKTRLRHFPAQGNPGCGRYRGGMEIAATGKTGRPTEGGAKNRKENEQTHPVAGIVKRNSYLCGSFRRVCRKIFYEQLTIRA